MKLDDGRGTIFELDIVGYQFEDPKQGSNSPDFDFSDCNWLMVRGRITIPPPGKPWEFLEPCLNTKELKALAEWFDKISNSPIPRLATFMEPNLKLSFSSLPSPTIKVTLSHGSASPWNKHTFLDFDELTFPMNCNDPTRIAMELHDLATRVPSRLPGVPA